MLEWVGETEPLSSAAEDPWARSGSFHFATAITTFASSLPNSLFIALIRWFFNFYDHSLLVVYFIPVREFCFGRRCLWKGRLRHGKRCSVTGRTWLTGLPRVPTQSFRKRDFALATQEYMINGVSTIFDIGNIIVQAGADFGANLNGLVQQFFRSLPVPVPFKHEESSVRVEGGDKGWQRGGVGIAVPEDLGLGSISERLKNHGFAENVRMGRGNRTLKFCW